MLLLRLQLIISYVNVEVTLCCVSFACCCYVVRVLEVFGCAYELNSGIRTEIPIADEVEQEIEISAALPSYLNSQERPAYTGPSNLQLNVSWDPS
jgi:hypothetical protein